MGKRFLLGEGFHGLPGSSLLASTARLRTGCGGPEPLFHSHMGNHRGVYGCSADYGCFDCLLRVSLLSLFCVLWGMPARRRRWRRRCGLSGCGSGEADERGPACDDADAHSGEVSAERSGGCTVRCQRIVLQPPAAAAATGAPATAVSGAAAAQLWRRAAREPVLRQRPAPVANYNAPYDPSAG